MSEGKEVVTRLQLTWMSVFLERLFEFCTRLDYTMLTTLTLWSSVHCTDHNTIIPNTDSLIACAMFEAVNLEQRPSSHPICGFLCPTLLRHSSMWLLSMDAPLTGEETLDSESCWYDLVCRNSNSTQYICMLVITVII